MLLVDVTPVLLDVAAVAAELGLEAADVAVAASILTAPAWAGLPGAPWTAGQVAAVLPLLAEGPSDLVVEAWGARMLTADVI